MEEYYEDRAKSFEESQLRTAWNLSPETRIYTIGEAATRDNVNTDDDEVADEDFVYLPNASHIERFMANDFRYERVYLDDEHYILQKYWSSPV